MNATTKPRLRVRAGSAVVPAVINGFNPPHVLHDRVRPGAQFMRGEASPVFFDWQPVLRDPREDVRAAYWRAAARTIDLMHNSGWVAGIVRKGCASIMGTGLRLALKPNFDSLGWTQEASAQWARKVEREFDTWANSPLECDAAGKWTLDQLANAALRSYFGPGEWIAWMRWISRPISKTKTKVQLIPSHRLTQESNGLNLFQGVRVDSNAMPISYRLRLTQPILDTGQTIEIRARDSAGRSIIAHGFEGDVGQMRGISIFAPVLRVLKQFDQLADTTLTAAMIQTIVAATITSSAPTSEVLNAFEAMDDQGVGGNIDAYMDARASWHENTKIDLAGQARIAHLFPGEALDLKRAETPNANYEPFARFLLRETAACAGFTAEDVTGDYTGATYSSIKMSTTTNWPIQQWRRRHVLAPFYQAVFECWLEEAIESGEIEFPDGIEGFQANRNAACRASWRGPAKPVPDELKAANAAQIESGLGITTDEQLCADRGEDWEDVYEQRAREAAKRKELNLPEPVLGGASPPKDGVEETPPPKKPRGPQ